MNTRTALLDSAEALARQRGYEGFSYADLAREVGIKKPSVHHHFPTKADLALGIVQRYRERFSVELDRLARHRHGRDRLEGYLALYRDALCGGQQVCLCVAFSAGPESLSDAVLAELHLFDELNIAWVAETLRRGRDDGSIRGVENPRAEATACVALVEGAQLLARSAKDVSRFDAATAELRARIT